MEDISNVTDDLSDSELRRRLAQYGFPNLPVTDTTRKVLLKKLKNAITSENTKSRRETVAVSKFSDEEAEVKAKAIKASNRRATVAITEKSSVKKVNNTAIVETVETPSKKSSRKKSSSQARILQDDSSDEDIIEVENRRSNSRTKTPTLGKSDVVRTSNKTSVDVVEEIAEEPPVIINPVSRRKTFTTSTSNFSTNQGNSISNSNARQTYDFKQPVEDEPFDDLDTPYLSNFAKRLSTLRAEPLDAEMDKYKRLRETGASLGYKSNSNINIQAQPAQRKEEGVMKSLGQLADNLDQQHNFRNILYISFIVMIVVAIYVIFFM